MKFSLRRNLVFKKSCAFDEDLLKKKIVFFGEKGKNT